MKTTFKLTAFAAAIAVSGVVNAQTEDVQAYIESVQEAAAPPCTPGIPGPGPNLGDCDGDDLAAAPTYVGGIAAAASAVPTPGGGDPLPVPAVPPEGGLLPPELQGPLAELESGLRENGGEPVADILFGEVTSTSPYDTQTEEIAVTASGTMPPADEACSVDQSALNFDFDGATYSAFTGQSLEQSIVVACGEDRVGTASITLSTTDAEATPTSGYVGTVGTNNSVAFTLEYDNAGAFEAVGADVAEATADDDAPIDLRLTFDKTTAKEGGAVSLPASSKLYVFIN